MAKRKQEDPPKGSPAWMSTFSDLMNLLLCFFVLLFASSTIDAQKLEEISASFTRDSIFSAGSTAIGEGQMVSSGVKQLSLLDNYVQSLGRNQKGTSSNLSDNATPTKNQIDANKPDDKLQDEKTSEQQATTQQQSQDKSSQTTQTTQDLQQQVKDVGYEQSEMMTKEIEQMLKTSQISEKVSLDYNAQYVELALNGGVLFDSGKAELTDNAKNLVSKVGDILVRYRKRIIEIEGHTDNVPAGGGEYKDNQYLSSARAISVYQYLIDNKNLIPANMKHSGYGDTRPKASNKTEKGRAINRRVEIKIYNKISSDN